ncbi:hypothetical protein [Actinophytocola sp.]|uniref:hypothetical protein n=1 Tax=Actinophytocola sp. TaxID=1872138 RepID=UPI003D6AC1C5
MDALTAAVVLAWIVLIVLAFAMAGLLHQLRDVRAALRRRAPAGHASSAPPPGGPVSVRPTGAKVRSVVLLVDGHCPTCAEVAPVFADLARAGSADVDSADIDSADVDFVVLSYAANDLGDDLDGVRYVVDSGAYHHLDPGWRPAIVVVGPDGEVEATEPAGSEAAVRALVTNLVTTGTASR